MFGAHHIERGDVICVENVESRLAFEEGASCSLPVKGKGNVERGVERGGGLEVDVHPQAEEQLDDLCLSTSSGVVEDRPFFPVTLFVTFSLVVVGSGGLAGGRSEDLAAVFSHEGEDE